MSSIGPVVPNPMPYPQPQLQTQPAPFAPGTGPQANYYYGPQSIAAPPAAQTLAVQQYLPIAPRHQTTQQDEFAIQQGLNRWYPKIMPGYSTPLPQMLSSPEKTAILTGGITGGLMTLFGMMVRNPLLSLGGLLMGAFVGVTSYFSSRQRNDNILDMMTRLPEGATRRDMLSDPVVQQERTQAAMAAGGGGFGNDLLTAALVSNMMSSGRGGYSSRSRSRR